MVEYPLTISWISINQLNHIGVPQLNCHVWAFNINTWKMPVRLITRYIPNHPLIQRSHRVYRFTCCLAKIDQRHCTCSTVGCCHNVNGSESSVVYSLTSGEIYAFPRFTFRGTSDRGSIHAPFRGSECEV